MDQTPSTWGVHKMGYTHRVCIVNQFGECYNSAQLISNWLHTQLGGIDEHMWIDQYDYICFVHETHALLFEMIWCASCIRS